MRRLVATTLLLMLVTTLVSAPAAASLTNGTHATPACCRAHGAHHCSAPASTPEGNRMACQPLACPYSQPVLVPHVARPQPQPAVADSLDAHPFIMEFFPGAVPDADESRPSDRGPPLAFSR
jgi:hypothetical protein